MAVNLAETLAQNGHRVALVDGDFGQGACAILLNETPQYSVLDVALQVARPEQVQHATQSGITLIQGVAEPGEADGRERRLYTALDDLIRRLRLNHEYIIIDAPAGVDGPVRWALDRSDLGVLVLVGEPTAISDVYQLTKMIWQADPAYPMSAIVNFSDSEEEAKSVAERFNKITTHFLQHTPSYLGWVPFSAHVRRSVKEQHPAVRSAGVVRDAFKHIAQVIQHGRSVVNEQQPKFSSGASIGSAEM